MNLSMGRKLNEQPFQFAEHQQYHVALSQNARLCYDVTVLLIFARWLLSSQPRAKSGILKRAGEKKESQTSCEASRMILNRNLHHKLRSPLEYEILQRKK